MPTDALDTRASSLEREPLEENYQSVSGLSVAALLTGLASSLALIHPLLVFVAVLGVILALVALRSIASSDGQLGGQGLAVAGLCLAVLFSGWSLAGSVSASMALRQQAREFVDDWLHILASGQKYYAHQLYAERGHRMDPHGQVEQTYAANEAARENFENFFKNAALQAFLARGKEVDFRFEAITRHVKATPVIDELELRYRFDGPNGPQPMWIIVRREYSTAFSSYDWRIYQVREYPPAE
jgi:hypothetical protein